MSNTIYGYNNPPLPADFCGHCFYCVAGTSPLVCYSAPDGAVTRIPPPLPTDVCLSPPAALIVSCIPASFVTSTTATLRADITGTLPTGAQVNFKMSTNQAGPFQNVAVLNATVGTNAFPVTGLSPSDTIYYFAKVVDVTGTVLIAASPTCSFITLPANNIVDPPALGTATVTGCGTAQVTVNTCSPGATVAITQRSVPTGLGNDNQLVVQACSLSANFTVTPGVTYTYSATQTISGNTSAASPLINLSVPAPQVLNAPGLGTPVVTGGTVAISIVSCAPGATVTVTQLPGGATQQAICSPAASVSFVGLPAGTYTYSARQSAPCSTTSGQGNTVSATVAAAAALAITCAPGAAAITSAGATLRGTISGAIPAGWLMIIQYSTDQLSWTPSTPVAAVAGVFSVPVTGLTPLTPYFYQVIVYDPAPPNNGVNSGSCLFSTTAGGSLGPLTVVCAPATQVTATSATLNGIVGGNIPTGWRFQCQYSTDNLVWTVAQNIPAVTGATAALVTGLTPNTLYYWQNIVYDPTVAGVGTNSGSCTMTTAATTGGAPTAACSPAGAANISDNGVTLTGVIGGTIPAGWQMAMQYGTNNTTWTLVGATAAVAGNFVVNIGGLTADTPYYYQVLVYDPAVLGSGSNSGSCTFRTTNGAVVVPGGDPPQFPSAQGVVNDMQISASCPGCTQKVPVPGGPVYTQWGYCANRCGAVNSVGANLKHGRDARLGCSDADYGARLVYAFVQWLTIAFRTPYTGNSNVIVECVPYKMQGRVKPSIIGNSSTWVDLSFPTGDVHPALIEGNGDFNGTILPRTAFTRTAADGHIYKGTRYALTPGGLSHPWAAYSDGSIFHPRAPQVSDNSNGDYSNSQLDCVTGTWFVRGVGADGNVPDLTSNPIEVVSAADPYARPSGQENQSCKAGVAASGSKVLTTAWQQVSFATLLGTPDSHNPQQDGVDGITMAAFLANRPTGMLP